MFRGKHGLEVFEGTQNEILDRFINIALSVSEQWEENANEIRMILDGTKVIIRFYVQNGEMIMINAFTGDSNQIIGHLIEMH